MKLAEALIVRRDLQNKLNELQNTLINSALIEEGDTLDIPIKDLLAEYEAVGQQLSQLVVQINQRNQEIKVADSNDSLQVILEKRENLRRRHNLYTQIIEATGANRRYGRNEIKMTRTVNLKEMTALLDQVAKEIRETDALIQQTNWLQDL